MVSHQPRDSSCFVLAEAVFQAERLGINSAEFRVITAASLGNVMKQAAQIRNLGLCEALHDAAAMWVFMIESSESETSQVADDKKRMFVDRVGMKQVVLHASDDAAERRYIQAEHAVQIHAPQFVCHPLRRAQDGKEQTVVSRVLPKLLIDQVQAALDQAHRVGTDTANLGVLLQQEEQLE